MQTRIRLVLLAACISVALMACAKKGMESNAVPQKAVPPAPAEVAEPEPAKAEEAEAEVEEAEEAEAPATAAPGVADDADTEGVQPDTAARGGKKRKAASEPEVDAGSLDPLKVAPKAKGTPESPEVIEAKAVPGP